MHNPATLAAAISVVLMCAITLAGTGLSSPPSSLEEVVDLLPQGTTRQELNQASMQLAGTIVTVPVCTMGSCRQYDACMDRCVFLSSPIVKIITVALVQPKGPRAGGWLLIFLAPPTDSTS
jgi:hypothetical protein